MSKLNIVIADDHPLFRDGVALLLSSTEDFHLKYQVGDGAELLALLHQYKNGPLFPDICLLDINMPNKNGYETMQELGEQYPDLPVLVLTMYSADYSVLNMMRLGARGFLPKNCKKEMLFEALEQLRNGDYFIPREKSRVLIASNRQQVHGLSEREREFLTYCHEDLSYKDIGEKMHCSERTVHGYRDSLFQKLNRKSRNGLVAYAFSTGIISLQ